MARIEIPLVAASLSAINDVAALMVAGDSAAGAKWKNDGEVLLVILNTGAGPHVVTVQTPQQVSGLAVADLSVAVAAGKMAILGPFPSMTFAQPNGADQRYVYVSADAGATVMPTSTQAEVKYLALQVRRA